MNLTEYIEEGVRARSAINPNEIRTVASLIYESIKSGGKLITFGNGGSAADAQHFAAEFSGRFMIERSPLPAVALTTNTSSLTAIGNDYSYDEIFSRQIRGLASERDFVVGISTSGNSKNVLYGIVEANKIGAYTLALTGKSGGILLPEAKKTIVVESTLTPIIQEVHIAIVHMLCMETDRLILYGTNHDSE